MGQDILFKDYYRILEVPPDADTETIKTAFRFLARKTHPDVSDDPSNYAAFVLIREAYEILTDTSRRETYHALWTRYQGDTHRKKGDENYFHSVYRDFGDPGEGAYEDEWEFFVRDPDEYLGMFEKTVKLFTASMLASIISGLVTAGVFSFLCVMLCLLLVLTASIMFFVSFASSSAMAGIIITFLFIRRLVERLRFFSGRLIPRLADLIIRPLKGIPIARGKWMIYCGYSATIIMLVVYGWISITWIGDFFLERPLSLYTVLATGGISIGVVLVASFSTAIMFDIIHAALSGYPRITYTRFTAKKYTGIGYSHPLLGNATKNRIGE
jgi:hypothetical protein